LVYFEIPHQKTSHNLKKQLKAVLQEEWLKINPETTEKLVISMRCRLQAVIDAEAYPTAY
jgi:hypothetical protein